MPSGPGSTQALTGPPALDPRGDQFTPQPAPMALGISNSCSGGVTAGILSASGSASLQAAPTFPSTLLTMKYELLINGTWTDITNFVYQRDDVSIGRGKPNETSTATPGQITITLNNRDGRFTPKNISGAYYPYIGRNTQLRLSLVNITSSTGSKYTGYRFWGEVSVWPPQWDSTGRDVFCSITVSGVLRRYIQGSNIGSAVKRYYTRLSDNTVPYAMWLAEDSSGSSVIASALSNVGPMGFTGTPGFSSDPSFGGLDSIPTIAGSSWHGQTLAATNPPGTGSITQSTPGVYNITCPPGVSTFACIGLGSGGAGGDTGAASGGGGGGGGEYASANISVTAGHVYQYTVPAGGGAVANSNGGNGASAIFTGDGGSQLVAHGGSGGKVGNTSSGGAGGSGSSNTVHHSGGSGGTGQSSSTSFFQQSLNGSSGTPAAGSGGGGQASTGWVSPITGTVNVQAQGAGGGGAGGGYFGYGGAGGGGGGYQSGSIDVTSGSNYTFFAGNGGPGGFGNSNLQNISGGFGGGSNVQGDSILVNGGGAGGGVASSVQHNLGGNPGTGATANGGAGGISNNTSSIGGGAGGGDSGQDGGAVGNTASGRTPGGANAAGAGGGWGATSTGGGGATPGNTATAFGGGGGGGGSINGTNGRYGGGGGPGFINWQWSVPNSPSAGGGAGSGGTSSAGSGGGNDGTTSPAVSGGGAGGDAGNAGGAPGGGGGGGLLDIGNGVLTPGNGGPGQVSLSWNGGTVSPVAGDIIRFALHVNSTGTVEGAVLLRAITFGTIAKLDLLYHTGGNLELIGYNGSGGQLFTSGSKAFNANGMPMYVSIELSANGTSANWKLTAIQPGASVAIATFTGTVGTASIGYVSDIFVNPLIQITTNDSSTALGGITVQTYSVDITQISTVINGYSGELAADRFTRICSEMGITSRLIGNNTDTPKMGAQADDTVTNLLQTVEDLDKGQLFELRDALGLGYRTRVNLQSQSPALVIDYSLAQLSGPLQPTVDDQLARNDITVSRRLGSSVTVTQMTGSMSVQSPPAGIGDYTSQVSVAAFSDNQLPNLAAWLLALGTVDEQRYPTIPIDLSRLSAAPILQAVANLDIGDFLQIINPPAFLANGTISQLALGFTEILNNFKWQVAINAVPESPYSEGNPPTWLYTFAKE